jgi:PIN domain nuclease of toxin-antitoxin system
VSYVIDASALLAVLQKEIGYLSVVPLLNGAYFSTVNLSEVLQKSEQKGLKISNLVSSLEGLGLNLVSFTPEQAELTASLWKSTQPYGLSLGDRACLALAQSLNAIAVTADKAWANIPNIQVQVIR